MQVNESESAWENFQISEHAWIWSHGVNNNVNCIPEEDRFQVLNDLPNNGQIVDGSHLKSQSIEVVKQMKNFKTVLHTGFSEMKTLTVLSKKGRSKNAIDKKKN